MTDATTEMLLIRHGETDWNAEARVQGHLDIPLNDVGIAQAAALGRRFLTETCDVVYSSDLKRAAATATCIAAPRGLPITHDARLRERNLGVLQGLTRDEALKRHPTAWEAFKRRQPTEALEGGESLSAFSHRVRDFLHEIAERHVGKTIVVVTHGGVLDLAHRWATGQALEAPRDFPVLNAAVNALSHRGQWRLKNWGDVSHLAGDPSKAASGADFIDHAGVPAPVG